MHSDHYNYLPTQFVAACLFSVRNMKKHIKPTNVGHEITVFSITSVTRTLGRVAQSVGHLTRKFRGPGFDTRSGNILSFLLPLFQEGQLSVTGESMCTKYWLTA